MLGMSKLGPLGALRAGAASAGSSAPASAPAGDEAEGKEFDPEKIKAILAGSKSLEDAVSQIMAYISSADESEDSGEESEAPSASDQEEPAPTA